jgi:peptide/nickel transport system substrate-binding protein
VRSEKFKDLALELIWDNDMVMLPAPKALTIWWPWLQNYYGEINFGYQNPVPAISRMWIDESIKDELGY